MIPDVVAWAWLGRGVKYEVSRRLAGAVWHTPFAAVLAKHGIRLKGAASLRDVLDALKGRVSYDWDPFHGAIDYVMPPATTLASGMGDCDDQAWLHACAVEHALGPLGWTAAIVQYLSDPWIYSHHVCAARDRDGKIWAVQPWPAKWQPQDLDPLWPEPFDFYRDLAVGIARDGYAARVRAFDVRDTTWRVIEPWRWLN